jgi:cytochrome c
MDSFEFNKIAGAILGALLFTLATGVIAEVVFSSPTPAKPGYALPSAAPEGAAGGEAKAAPQVPLADLLAKADPKKGEADTKACQACHDFQKGGGIKVGPPLYGVVGRPKASVAGFDYSTGLKAKGGNWTYEDLDTWIADPKAYVSGTKMAFSGIPEAEKRADVLAYLKTLSDSPVPFPKPEPAKAAAPAAAPAGGAPAPAPEKGAAPAPAPAKGAAPAPAPAAPPASKQ